MAQTKEQDKFVDWVQSGFRDAYTDAYPYLKRAELIQKAFNCEIDEENWSTVSQIFFPILRSAVMYVLPYIFQYLFPEDGFIQLIPAKDKMKFDDVTRIESFLEDLMIWKMKIRRDGLLTLQDALKFGCGYGIVEKKVITPPATKSATATVGGRRVQSKTVMTAGAPTEVVSYRYLPYSQIIPTQDGDRPDDVSCVYFLDFVREDILRKMYAAEEAKDPEDRIYSGDPEEIIQNTKDRKMDGNMYHLWWIMQSCGNKVGNIIKHNENAIRNDDGTHSGPVLVPILKCFYKNHHAWLANGDTVIYEAKDEYETLRCPIIKATATPDAGNWYANSDVSASQDVADGITIFKNSILDLMTYWLHPPTIYNQDMLADPSSVPDTGPFGEIKVYNTEDATRAVAHMQGPAIPDAVAGYGMQMEQDLAHGTGRSMALETNSLGGLTRAGSGATESLLQNMSARQELIASVLQMDWMEDIALNTMAMLQTMDADMSTMKRDNKNREFVEVSVSQEDIRHVFDARIDFGGENKSVNDKLVDIQLYQLMIKGNPEFSQTAPVADIVGAKKVERWKASPEEYKQNIANMQAQQQGSLTRGQQAVAGGAAQAGGVV
jgi:hypothetical protein